MTITMLCSLCLRVIPFGSTTCICQTPTVYTTTGGAGGISISTRRISELEAALAERDARIAVLEKELQLLKSEGGLRREYYRLLDQHQNLRMALIDIWARAEKELEAGR